MQKPPTESKAIRITFDAYSRLVQQQAVIMKATSKRLTLGEVASQLILNQTHGRTRS